MRRSGCESEAVANVLMQMRVGKTGSAGIVLGKQRCDCCYTDSFPHFHCTRRSFNIQIYSVDKSTADREQTMAEVSLLECIEQ